jgi:hypothetical protein
MIESVAEIVSFDQTTDLQFNQTEEQVKVVKELNEDVQEEIINIINNNNKILEEIINNPRLYLEKNKLSSNSKKDY